MGTSSNGANIYPEHNNSPSRSTSIPATPWAQFCLPSPSSHQDVVGNLHFQDQITFHKEFAAAATNPVPAITHIFKVLTTAYNATLRSNYRRGCWDRTHSRKSRCACFRARGTRIRCEGSSSRGQNFSVTGSKYHGQGEPSLFTRQHEHRIEPTIRTFFGKFDCV
jgi:hypothetical protein